LKKFFSKKSCVPWAEHECVSSFLSSTSPLSSAQGYPKGQHIRWQCQSAHGTPEKPDISTIPQKILV